MNGVPLKKSQPGLHNSDFNGCRCEQSQRGQDQSIDDALFAKQKGKLRGKARTRFWQRIRKSFGIVKISKGFGKEKVIKEKEWYCKGWLTRPLWRRSEGRLDGGT